MAFSQAMAFSKALDLLDKHGVQLDKANYEMSLADFA